MIAFITCATLILGFTALCLGVRLGITRMPKCSMPGAAIGCYLTVFVASIIIGGIVGPFSTEGVMLWTVKVLLICLTTFAVGHLAGYLIRPLWEARTKNQRAGRQNRP